MFRAGWLERPKADPIPRIILGALVCLLPHSAIAQPLEQVTVVGARDSDTSSASFNTTALAASGVTSLSDIGQAVPGLRFDAFGPSAQPTMRGAGVQNVLGPGVESEVAVYLDGFRQNNLDSLVFDLADVASVDVLKGPQGSQFGENAIGGAILLTTPSPEFTSRGDISISYGAFGDKRIHAYADVALSNTLAADFSVYHRDSDNYFTDISTGKPSAPIHSVALRSKLLFQPNANSRIVLTAQYSDIEDPTNLAYTVSNPVAAFYHDSLGVPITATTTPYLTSLGRNLQNNPRTWSLSLTGAFNLDWVTLTTRSQFRAEHGNVAADLDGTTIQYWNLDYGQSDQTFSQEVDLTSSGTGPLRWRTGLTASNDLGGLTYYIWQDIFNSGAAMPLVDSRIRVSTTALGLFGDIDYTLADHWTLSAGARLSYESKSMRSVLLIAPYAPGTGAKAWEAFTPRIELDRELDGGGKLYGSVTNGFKSGNFNYIGTGDQQAVKAEYVTQYEAGYKYNDKRWSLDAATYFSTYRDLQAFTYKSTCSCFQFSNAPRAQVYGVEADVGIPLDDEWSVRGAVAYTHARYLEFVGEAPTGGPAIPPSYGYSTGPINFAGDSMIRSPDWTGNIDVAWHRSTAVGNWTSSANLYLTNTVPFTPDRQLAQDSYGLLNLSVGWSSLEGAWSVLATGNNVTGRKYQLFAAEGLLGRSSVYGAPASWLLTIDRHF